MMMMMMMSGTQNFNSIKHCPDVVYRMIKHVNNSSAVTEMGDHLATVDTGQKLGGCAPYAGNLDPYVTQCGLDQGLPLYRVAS